MTEIPSRDRLIFALDVPSAAEARRWIDLLGDAITYYKLGMELLTSGDYFRVLEDLAGRGKQIFVDLKFHDVPATVGHAVAGIARYPVGLCTIHAQQSGMIEAAAAAKGSVKLLGVTVLTSMDASDLAELGITRGPEAQVLDRARAALRHGCDGVVASGQEAGALRSALGPEALIVCPGIRPGGPVGDDQKRTVDVATAFARGASHIVVGRPIRQAADPRAAAEAMQAEIAACFK
ncbi:orotidine-5'-phosphate decarboxylase [Pseudomarimonas salicorniae]|uniref:Orotidine 5'-phosphate decarboxylase n=1 Tax=Pseudomarimonas salicorniae TaxID=2933270 RepID=A0ABT0GIR3_9GAMM|nr:orotidine-5'-phosphate decarboxylase [Lysobacter sp. CAU 1642]MCK7594427.1 orotidine-5'-phosphate decarboxylase [Lysobacter sp. CAU 1642]